MRLSGQGVVKAFEHETGQHCIQRIPPTEHNGRKQTSYVSVAVLPLPPERTMQSLPTHEVDIQTTKGRGPGGQNKNKVESAVRARHKPTGLEVFIDGRDQGQNKRIAMRILSAKVNELRQNQVNAQYNALRRERLGKGNRGEKIRTYNYLEGRAVDHRTGRKTTNVRDIIEKGKFGLLL